MTPERAWAAQSQFPTWAELMLRFANAAYELGLPVPVCVELWMGAEARDGADQLHFGVARSTMQPGRFVFFDSSTRGSGRTFV
jgi:hypothetical protein